MPPAIAPVLTPAARAASVVLLPGEKFFVRRVPLAPEGDVAAQVALVLEGLSPFPASQLYFGFRANPARTQAFVFAAFRRSFTAEETAGWAGAAAVIPDFAVWLGAGSLPAAGLSWREHDARLEVVAWDGRSELPAALIVRLKEAAEPAELVAEAIRKSGLPAGTPVKVVTGTATATRGKRELVVTLGPGGAEARFDETALGQLDVRDKGVLIERRQALRRDMLLWRGFATLLGGLAACAVLELGLLLGRGWLSTRQAEIDALAPAVKQIDQAQTLAKRLEEISSQRLLPFEMLAVLNRKRPNSVMYTRASTSGLWRIDLEAQTTNASDLRDFEADLRKLAGVEHVELREPRTREGLTTFLMEITFKPGWWKAGGGA
jgi:hypothetical protein